MPGFQGTSLMSSPAQNRWLPIATLLGAMLLWASSFIAFKLALRGYHANVIVFGRMVVASLFFAFMLRKRSFTGLRWRRQDVKWIALMALFEPCLYFAFEARALVLTTASQAGMITSVLPLLVGIAAALLLKERLRARTLIGFVVAICGVAWLTLEAEASQHAPNPLLGNLLEVAAMVCAAGYSIQLKQLTSRYSPIALTGLQALIGALFFAPWLLLPSTQLPTQIPLTPTLAVAYLGIAVTLGAYGLYNYGVSRIPVSQASAFVNLIPVFTIVLGRLVLGERMNAGQYAACLVVFVGVFMSRDRRAPEEPAEPTASETSTAPCVPSPHH